MYVFLWYTFCWTVHFVRLTLSVKRWDTRRIKRNCLRFVQLSKINSSRRNFIKSGFLCEESIESDVSVRTTSVAGVAGWCWWMCWPVSQCSSRLRRELARVSTTFRYLAIEIQTSPIVCATVLILVAGHVLCGDLNYTVQVTAYNTSSNYLHCPIRSGH